MSSIRPLVAVVTGANKGIGKAIVRNIVLKYPNSQLGKRGNPLLVYLTARDEGRGRETLKELNEELFKSKRSEKSSLEFHQLDINDGGSIVQLFKDLKEKHGGVDILINNAGIATKGSRFDEEVVKDTLECNYYGTMNVINQAIPLMKDQEVARIVNVSSSVSSLEKVSKEIAERFRGATQTKQITELLEEFTEAVKKGDYREKGWPSTAYGVSKMGVTGFTRTFQKEFDSQGINITMNCCCPGWVKTDMAGDKAPRTPDQGAETPVFLAIEDVGGTKGAFWKDNKVVEW